MCLYACTLWTEGELQLPIDHIPAVLIPILWSKHEIYPNTGLGFNKGPPQDQK